MCVSLCVDVVVLSAVLFAHVTACLLAGFSKSLCVCVSVVALWFVWLQCVLRCVVLSRVLLFGCVRFTVRCCCVFVCWFLSLLV